MGWFNSVINFGKKVIGSIGPALKKIGTVGMNIGRKLGEWSPAIGNILGTAIDGIGAVTGQAELIPLGEGIRGIGNMIGSYANSAHQISSHVANAGDSFNNLTSSFGD